jgi:uncharacterized protein YegP (UPF0339 family)
MPSAFILKKSANDQFFFNLTAENNETILTSEMYWEKRSAMDGVQSVRANAPEDASFVRKTSSDGKPYFVLESHNHEPIGSSEMYESREAMENGIAAVKRCAAEAKIQDRS